MPLNLNEGACEGGQLRFRFSGSLQHEALPVATGRRFALLSFFYDEPVL